MESKLKKLRKEKSITITSMAEMLGITKPAYYYYEEGRCKIPACTANNICRILGVTVDDIFLPASFTIC